MDDICKKKYKTFNEFYKTGFDIVKEIKSNTIGMFANERVVYARNYVIKDILNSYINIGKLSKESIETLNSSSNVLKFSMDNLIKNLITHSDVKYEDYEKISLIANNPSKIVKSKTNYDILLFKESEKYYKLVVKTTRNRKENFVKSFHIIKEDRFERY